MGTPSSSACGPASVELGAQNETGKTTVMAPNQASSILGALENLSSLVQSSEARLVARMEALEGTVRKEASGLNAKLDTISKQVSAVDERLAQGHNETNTLQAKI